MRIGPIDEVQVRMAQPAGLGVYQDLVRAGLGQLDLADGELADALKDRRLRHQRVAPMSPELMRSLPGCGACLANSMRAIERA